MDGEDLNQPKRHMPLLCWDICAMHNLEIKAKNDKETELKVLEEYRNEYDWDVRLAKILESAYEGLVLTDKEIKIQWVNGGFTKMTGFGAGEVIGKSPKILQGEKTSAEVRLRIREQLYGNKPFTESLVNYRKNGEEYVCKVEIHPVFNSESELSHFLALESETS